jgi:hypothetical protein
MKMTDCSIIKELRQLSAITSGRQRAYYEFLLSKATSVRISPLREIFNEDEIQRIKLAVNPQAKECFKNATLVCSLFPDRVKYVEGRFTVCRVFSTEHAWNRLGDKYFDVTMELALGRNPEDEEYVTFGDYDNEELCEYLLDAKVYGNIMWTDFCKIFSY